jgi:arylsulfatase A-like enzyme
VISWPAKIKDKGGIRNQFHHVIDIVPTLLQATGIPAPIMVDGFAQKPIEGVSMAYTFDKANADGPSLHHIQYFEMLGVQGLYDDGWMLSAVPKRPPWNLTGPAILNPATAFKYELYDLRSDWTQNTDVAAQHPEKVREMASSPSIRFCPSTLRPRLALLRRVPRWPRAGEYLRTQALR